MDCNSIIYDSVHSLEKSIQDGKMDMPADFEQSVINSVVGNIENYIKMINPTESIFIAFDGVAPFAKMDQQRTRRHKTLFLSNVDYGQDKNENKWNTSAITPGTRFMEKLSNKIDYEFKHAAGKYKVKNIIVSCSNVAGEGEHKLYSNIRSGNLINDNIAVYGLDSDLIMLSIFHLKYCKNIFVFRETPEFLKKLIQISKSDIEKPHFLDISLLSSSILSEMKCKYSDKQRIYDYVFLCFLLGNDFLPHFPAMNIRTHGIQGLLDIYRNCIGSFYDRFFISKNSGKIQWRNVGIFINEIAKREHEFLLNEYFLRDNLDKKQYLEKTALEKEDILTNVPMIYRVDEKYINPNEKYWEERYYKILFEIERNSENIKAICNNYMEGLEWVYKYYTHDCPNWRWKYEYHYPPLFSDLCKHIPHFEMDFIVNDDMNNRPFSPYAQLAYVLPYNNLSLLPSKIEEFLKNNYSEFYNEDYSFKWAFCRYFWEAHPVLPDMPLSLLNQLDIQFKIYNENMQ
jgi:5'-3' exonuclease